MFLSCIFVSLAGGLLILLTFSNNQLFVSLTFRFFISLISALLLFATSIEVQIGVYAPSVACLDSWMGKSLHLPGGWQYPTRHLLITFLAGRDTGAYLLLSMCSSWTRLRSGDIGAGRLLVGSDESADCPLGLLWCQHNIEVKEYFITVLEGAHSGSWYRNQWGSISPARSRAKPWASSFAVKKWSC